MLILLACLYYLLKLKEGLGYYLLTDYSVGFKLIISFLFYFKLKISFIFFGRIQGSCCFLFLGLKVVNVLGHFEVGPLLTFGLKIQHAQLIIRFTYPGPNKAEFHRREWARLYLFIYFLDDFIIFCAGSTFRYFFFAEYKPYLYHYDYYQSKYC